MSAVAPRRAAYLAAALLCGCSGSSSNLTTDSDSRTIADRKERLELLARYLKSKSPISDAEYIIHYRDNSGGGVPGPSDWDIRAALQVTEVAAWHAGWEPCAQPGQGSAEPVPAWARELLQRRPQWQHLPTPSCYRDPRHRASIALIYPDAGLVVYRNTSEVAAGEAR